MLLYKKVDIRRSELLTIHRIVAAWEVPILQAVHDEVTIGDDVLMDRAPPDAEDEYRRLTNLYKSSIEEDGSRGVSYAAAVYGQYNIGVAAIGRAIEHATVETVMPVTVDDLIGDLDLVSAGG